MAFDHEAMRLNGIYDFGDAGIGLLHRDFIHLNFIDGDLTERVIRRYGALTGREIDHRRVDLSTGMLRLSELAQDDEHPEHRGFVREAALSWLQR